MEGQIKLSLCHFIILLLLCPPLPPHPKILFIIASVRWRLFHLAANIAWEFVFTGNWSSFRKPRMAGCHPTKGMKMGTILLLIKNWKVLRTQNCSELFLSCIILRKTGLPSWSVKRYPKRSIYRLWYMLPLKAYCAGARGQGSEQATERESSGGGEGGINITALVWAECASRKSGSQSQLWKNRMHHGTSALKNMQAIAKETSQTKRSCD